MEKWTRLSVNKSLIDKSVVIKHEGKRLEGRIVKALSEETFVISTILGDQTVSIFDIIETK